MADDMKTLRGKLRKIVAAAWAVEGAKDFMTKLEEVFPEDLRDKYRACIDGATPRDCLRKEADEAGLRDIFESAWKDAPEPLLDKLAGVKTAWTEALRDQIMKVMEKLDIPDLYSLCMEGDFAAVATKAGLPTEPASFRECARSVAKTKKLRKELRSIWGKKA